MNIAIIQPTPFRKGHYFIYTSSLFKEIQRTKHFVRIISSTKTYKNLKIEKSTKFDFNLVSISGLITYYSLCFLTIIRFLYQRKKFNRIIILDVEYSCVSILLFFLKILRWKGKLTIQVNAPNFNYSFKKDRLNILRILKFLQSYIFKFSLKSHALKISCLGEWHKQKLSKQLNFNKNKIIVIEDGGGGVISKLSEEEITRNLNKFKINYPKTNKKIFLLFGNLRKDKGHLYVASTWNKYFSEIDDPYLWIVGHDEENLKDIILKNKSNNIIIHNKYIPLNLINTIYQKADFAILPYLSNYSGGSGPLMKGAFTHSKLALVSNVSEMGRLATEENLAKFFEPENMFSLSSCVREVLMQKQDHYSDMIVRANKYANERDWFNLSQKFIESFN